MKTKILLFICMFFVFTSHAQGLEGKWAKDFESNGFPGIIQFNFTNAGDVVVKMTIDMSLNTGGGRGIVGNIYTSLTGKYSEDNGYVRINFDSTSAKAWNDIKVIGVDNTTKNQFMAGLRELMKEQKQELIQLAAEFNSKRLPYHFEGYGKYLNLDGTLLTEAK